MPHILVSCLCILVVATPLPAIAGDGNRVVGFVSPISEQTAPSAGRIALLQRLRELGWVEGLNLTMVYGYADGDNERLPLATRQVLSKNADVILAPGTQAAMAVMQATRSVPIVSIMGDPVGTGLVDSLNRPGGNLTGVSAQNTEEIPSKWIELLREMLPRLSRMAIVVNPDNALSNRLVSRVREEATLTKIKLLVLPASTREDFAAAFERAHREVQAVVVMADAIAVGNRQTIVELALKYKVPVLYGQGEFVDAGGLISYGPDPIAMWRKMADYVDKLLRGASPATLPIEQPVRFELAVNPTAAREIGLAIPNSIRMRADRTRN